ncbi:MAG: transglutaminase family protein [Rudaea sp.]|uniref:transglutaminase-like domain-containing protein n=1 Tax=Rudaea sp. TaxID=2136325 RepID=UPI0039E4519E
MIEKEQLLPTRCVESDAPAIVAFANDVAGGATDDVARAIHLYRAVRDGIVYDPYDRFANPQSCSALRALERGRGYCIPKAALLVAAARSLGIPGRLGFADVRNHLASRRLIEANNGSVFRWHCYAELHLDGRWVKATPAFDSDLCRRVRIEPLEFDGRHDSVFHAFDSGRKHMEYVRDRGHYDGVPHEDILATLRSESPALLEEAYFAGARAFVDEVQVH